MVNAYATGLEEKTKPLAERLPEIMDFLVGRYGSYPFDAAGNVFIQVSDDGPGTSPQTRAFHLGAASTFMDLNQVVHEQSHQWYGVSVAPRSTEDNCLSECFASYATWMWPLRETLESSGDIAPLFEAAADGDTGITHQPAIIVSADGLIDNRG